MIRRLAVLFLLGVSAASAQEVMAPKVITTSDASPHVTGSAPTGQGSMWLDSGGSSPLEKDFAARFFVEQGLVVRTFAGFDVGAYVNTTDSIDQHSLDWNRFARGSAGLKLVKTFNNRYVGGLIRGDVGYTAEHRFVSGATAAAPTFDINYWIGWQPQQGRLPGSSWGIAALNISPTELHNTLFNEFVKQGAVIWKAQDHGLSRPKPQLIGFGQVTVAKDMLGYDWNNFAREGAGLEIMVPTEHSTYEVGAMYMYETRTVIPRSGSGVEFFIRFWHGWQDRH
jgi:hypothetical protein